jgi:manganese transport protein
MDPGNWATDLGGGSKFGYALLSVVLLSSLMAMFLQALSAKLGIATGRDLAQACRDHYSHKTTIFLWIVCELAIAACDLAEVLGSAVALKLLFGLPLLLGVIITAFDVLLVLALQGKGFRLIEAFVVALIGTVGLCLRNFFRAAALAGSGVGIPAATGDFARQRNAIHRHRNPGRDGDAAQSVFALEHRADARVWAGRPRPARSHQVFDHRFDGGTDIRFVHQRGDSCPGRGGVPHARAQ